MEKETWKDIKGFEGQYRISSFGRLQHYTKRFGWNILKNTNEKGSYFSVILINRQGKNLSTRLHRLVAEAFIPNPNNYPTINHKDGNKQNNNVENLEWCTPKQNFKHAKENGLWKYNKPYKTTPVAQFSIDGKFIKIFPDTKQAQKETGVCSRNILQVVNKEEYNKEKHLTRKQAGGFIWKKAEEVI